MGEGFDHLRCPMCGGELIYSEGTHDLCCARNPYESMSGEEWEASAALHEGRAEYGESAGEGEAGRLYIYKVWNEGEEGGRLRQSAGGSASIDILKDADMDSRSGPGMTGESRYPLTLARSDSGSIEQDAGAHRCPSCGSDRMLACSHSFHAGERGIIEKTSGVAATENISEVSAGEGDRAQTSATPIKGHSCVFAVSFTESGRFGTLWSMRTVHAETNYFSLTRLMQKIEKRLKNGEPLAANAPNPPKKRERSAAAKLAFRFGIEEEDVYSIRFSTETVKRLALFYGISERDVRRIRKAEVGEE